MISEPVTQPDREQVRERLNTLRFLGGLFLIAALFLYFFHLAEAPMGHYLLGALAAAFALAGITLLWIGQRKLHRLP